MGIRTRNLPTRRRTLQPLAQWNGRRCVLTSIASAATCLCPALGCITPGMHEWSHIAPMCESSVYVFYHLICVNATNNLKTKTCVFSHWSSICYFRKSLERLKLLKHKNNSSIFLSLCISLLRVLDLDRWAAKQKHALLSAASSGQWQKTSIIRYTWHLSGTRNELLVNIVQYETSTHCNVSGSW